MSGESYRIRMGCHLVNGRQLILVRSVGQQVVVKELGRGIAALSDQLCKLSRNLHAWSVVTRVDPRNISERSGEPACILSDP